MKLNGHIISLLCSVTYECVLPLCFTWHRIKNFRCDSFETHQWSTNSDNLTLPLGLPEIAFILRTRCRLSVSVNHVLNTYRTYLVNEHYGFQIHRFMFYLALHSLGNQLVSAIFIIVQPNSINCQRSKIFW